MKKITLFFILAISVLFVYAKPVSKQAASNIAIGFYNHYFSPVKASDCTISESFNIEYNGLTTMYVFNFSCGGFVIIAADDASTPVLGYSGDGEVNQNSMNRELAWWLNGYSEQVEMIVQEKLSNKQTIKEWNSIVNGEFPESTRAVAPLLSTEWDQGNYYNDSCPVMAGGADGRAYAGCVATSMSQIMKYHAYPPKGVGSHSYTHPTLGTIKAVFSAATYSWSSMPNNVYSVNNQVARLLFHAGVSVNMQYSAQGSGASPTYISGAFINYFDYQKTAELKIKSDYTDAQWKTMLTNELDASRPINYAGNDANDQNGHSFVCDGYDATGKYHFNWGWSGSSDGYFAIGSLNPGGNFSYGNNIVMRIRPKANNVPIANFTQSSLTPAASTPVNFTDLSENSPTSWLWTFEGGTPATSTAQHPTGVTFATNGKKLVSLKASNSNGSDIRYMLINVGGTPSAWIKQNTGFTAASRGITHISIVNPLVVWATAFDGSGGDAVLTEYTKTVDGGNVWKPGTITGMPTGFALSGIWGISDTVAYACINPGTATGGKILRTGNGGTTWIEQTSANFTGSWANWVVFFNDADGVCQGDPVNNEFFIFTTSNGGTTWTKVDAAKIPNANAGEAGVVYIVDVVGNTIWFGTTLGRVFKSTDKGANWALTGATGLTLTANVYFRDANNGIAFQYEDKTVNPVKPFKTVKTTNGGTTWTAFTPTGAFTRGFLDYVPGTPSMWVSVGSSNSSNCTGCHIGSSYSIDDGASFKNIDTGSVQYTDVVFFDPNTGWAGGFNSSATSGGIFKWNQSYFVDISGEDVSILSGVKVFPNPSNGIYNISFSDIFLSKSSIEVYDMFGRLVKNETLYLNSENKVQIDLTGQTSGLYLMKITTGNTTTTTRVALVK